MNHGEKKQNSAKLNVVDNIGSFLFFAFFLLLRTRICERARERATAYNENFHRYAVCAHNSSQRLQPFWGQKLSGKSSMLRVTFLFLQSAVLLIL